MGASTTLTIRISQETKDRLEAVAQSNRRSKSFLAAEAIEEYLAVQAWQIEHIEKAKEAADRGELVDSSEVRAWARSLGTGNPLAMPRARKK
ncbi:MAG: CopG family ribbon-helix-helix protein [Beijerinckiaceae bacterium]